MLLLDYQNVLIQSVLTERFSGAAPVNIDQTVSDFDGVIFHISTPEAKTKIQVSIQIKCWRDLIKYGAEQVLNREYGEYVVPPEPGYDFSVTVDLENLPAEKEARDELVKKISLLKRNAMAAPFEHAYEEHYKLKEEASKFTSEEAPQGVREGGEVMSIHYREEEAIYVKASHDRVTVIFSTIFREETDRVFGKVFIQEFVDARRRAIQNAPQVLFRTDPPLELQGVPGVQNSSTGEIGYVTFVLFPRHLTPQRMPEVISHIQTFRDYFHYHIKASKAYIHSRMRRRTADFLQGKITFTLALSSAVILTIHSSPKSEARQRGKGAQDGQWTDFQSPRRLRKPLLEIPQRGAFFRCLKRHGKTGVVITLRIGLLEGRGVTGRGAGGVAICDWSVFRSP
ncbi:hypothetical protein FJTKL_10250 [Diaporthe vaccinii]|uniref:Arp2/3 complex 34 kDa subunit n=1 Tax=Diaporthe vaccinii TaxID=105482 RepID=A0ABR4EK92_9PEZI